MKVPPIVLRSQSNWAALNQEFKESGIALSSTRIQVFFVDTFRHVTRLLDSKKLAYHTYQLPDQKNLKTILRGIPKGISDVDIFEELKDLGYPVLQVRRIADHRFHITQARSAGNGRITKERKRQIHL